MAATCDTCHTNLDPAGGILVTPPQPGSTPKNLCMACFERMSGPDIQPEKAV